MSKSGINLQPLRDAIPKYKAHVEQQRAQRAVDKLAASLRANNARHAFDPDLPPDAVALMDEAFQRAPGADCWTDSSLVIETPAGAAPAAITTAAAVKSVSGSANARRRRRRRHRKIRRRRRRARRPRVRRRRSSANCAIGSITTTPKSTCSRVRLPKRPLSRCRCLSKSSNAQAAAGAARADASTTAKRPARPSSGSRSPACRAEGHCFATVPCCAGLFVVTPTRRSRVLS